MRFIPSLSEVPPFGVRSRNDQIERAETKSSSVYSLEMRATDTASTDE